MVQVTPFNLLVLTCHWTFFFVAEDKNQRGNTIRNRIGATESLKIKSTPKVIAETTFGVITDAPKHITSANDSFIDIDSLSTLTIPEVIQNKTIPPNDENTGHMST